MHRSRGSVIDATSAAQPRSKQPTSGRQRALLGIETSDQGTSDGRLRAMPLRMRLPLKEQSFNDFE